MQNIILVGESQKKWAKGQIEDAPFGWIVKIGEPTRTDQQNRLLHPLIREIMKAEPERWDGYVIEDAKAIFLDALKDEIRMLPKLNENGFFPAGRKTSTLSVSQFRDLLEIAYKYAAEKEIVLPDVRDRIDL